MNKSYRQGQILRIVNAARVHTQEDLAQRLREDCGIQATQVTLSRDIRELGLVKTPSGYKQLSATPGPKLAAVTAELLRDIRQAQNLIVLKTAPGNANALAVALDREELPEVTGTLAGDDTILVVTPDADSAKALRDRLLEYVSGED